MRNPINQLISDIRAECEATDIKRDVHTSLMHKVHIDIPTNLFNELKTMSAVYGVDSNRLAGELLTIALKEAISSLPESEHERLRAIRENYEKEQMRKSMELVQFSAGGT